MLEDFVKFARKELATYDLDWLCHQCDVDSPLQLIEEYNYSHYLDLMRDNPCMDHESWLYDDYKNNILPFLADQLFIEHDEDLLQFMQTTCHKYLRWFVDLYSCEIRTQLLNKLHLK